MRSREHFAGQVLLRVDVCRAVTFVLRARGRDRLLLLAAAAASEHDLARVVRRLTSSNRGQRKKQKIMYTGRGFSCVVWNSGETAIDLALALMTKQMYGRRMPTDA